MKDFNLLGHSELVIECVVLDLKVRELQDQLEFELKKRELAEKANWRLFKVAFALAIITVFLLIPGFAP